MYIYIYIYIYRERESERETCITTNTAVMHAPPPRLCLIRTEREDMCTQHGVYEERGHLKYFTEMCSGSEAGSYLRLIECCITQL